MVRLIKKIGLGLLYMIAGLVSAVIAAIAGWILYSRKYVQHNFPLPPALNAECKEFLSQCAGRLSYYLDLSGKGVPLVLLHSINAAPSAFEMKPVFEQYRGQRPVYALELPGFGFSERADRVYNPLLYQQAVTEFLQEIIAEPADLVALSLSCEFAALTAVHDPRLIRSLVMISPTGFNPPNPVPLPRRVRRLTARDNIYTVLSVSLWNRPLYDLVSSRPSIQFFLNKSFEDLVPESLIDYAYQTSHQPGAQYAPTYFLSGKLFTPAVRETVYQALDQPVLVVHDRDPYTRFEMLPSLLKHRSNWQAARITPTKGLPHWEKPTRTFTALDGFWASLE